MATTIEKHIIDHYDFIGITERMDESLAVMTLLWDLDASDVIVLSSKRSGGYDAGGGTGNQKRQRERKCTKIQKATRTRAIDAFFGSRAYQDGNADLLLYYAVNQSLDLTIQDIGETKVEQRVKQIQQLQKIAEAKCLDSAYFPCSANGTLQLELASQSCYVQDAGCGHQCVHEELRRYQHMSE